MTTGERIQELRKKKGMSQEKLAEALKVSRQAVSKWESNTHLPELDKCIELCKIFQVSLDELLLGEKPEVNNDTLNQMQELIDKISKTQPKRKYAKWLRTAAFILIGFMLFKLYNENNQLYNDIQNLNYSLNSIQNEIANQSSSLYYAVQSALDEQNNLLANWNIDINQVDYEKMRAELDIAITPKVYHEEDKAVLVLINSNNESYTIDLINKDSKFTGKADVSISDINEATILIQDKEAIHQMTFNPDLFLTTEVLLNDVYATQFYSGYSFFPEENKITIAIKFIGDEISMYNEMYRERADKYLKSVSFDLMFDGEVKASCPYNDLPETCKETIELQDDSIISIVFHYVDNHNLHYRLIDENFIYDAESRAIQGKEVINQLSISYNE